MLRRYLVFTFDNYYPRGGWNDFNGSFDTLEEAKAHLKASKSDWGQVIDSTNGNEVGYK